MVIQTRNKTITLNSDQINAVNVISKFLQGDENFICLSGSAGSGKTTILKQIIKGYEYYTACTAPTHKAKRVVFNALGLEAVTIHSLLGLRPDMMLEDFDNKNVLFAENGENKMSKFDIIIIDEASMLNMELVKKIKETALQYDTKIIFCGDANQLPPVKEQIASVFYDKDIKQVRLNIVERQNNGNPLIEIYASILSNIENDGTAYETVNKINENRQGIFFSQNIQEFGTLALEYFSSANYKNDKNLYRILAYENTTVNRWNNYIRKNIIGGIGARLCKGEVLMSYNSIYDNDRKEFKIQNSSEYEILAVNNDKIENISGEWLHLADLDQGGVKGVFIMDKNTDNYNIFLKKEQQLCNAAKLAKGHQRKYLWSKYYEYKNKFLLLEPIKDRHGNVLVKRDFDFSYALTIHKSQGSTYNTVFFDRTGLNKIQEHHFRNRLEYVALSRPTEAAYVNCA